MIFYFCWSFHLYTLGCDKLLLSNTHSSSSAAARPMYPSFPKFHWHLSFLWKFSTHSQHFPLMNAWKLRHMTVIKMHNVNIFCVEDQLLTFTLFTNNWKISQIFFILYISSLQKTLQPVLQIYCTLPVFPDIGHTLVIWLVHC